MPVRHSRAYPARSQRRKLVWASLDQNVVLAANANTTLNMLGQFQGIAGASTLGITIIRTHLLIGAQGTAPIAGDTLRVGLQVCRLSDIGAASILNAGDLEGDWMLLTRVPFVVGENEGALNGLMTWDIKAKRKMEELDQAYGLCLTALNSGRTLQVWARTLIALP